VNPYQGQGLAESPVGVASTSLGPDLPISDQARSVRDLYIPPMLRLSPSEDSIGLVHDYENPATPFFSTMTPDLKMLQARSASAPIPTQGFVEPSPNEGRFLIDDLARQPSFMEPSGSPHLLVREPQDGRALESKQTLALIDQGGFVGGAARDPLMMPASPQSVLLQREGPEMLTIQGIRPTSGIDYLFGNNQNYDLIRPEMVNVAFNQPNLQGTVTVDIEPNTVMFDAETPLEPLARQALVYSSSSIPVNPEIQFRAAFDAPVEVGPGLLQTILEQQGSTEPEYLRRIPMDVNWYEAQAQLPNFSGREFQNTDAQDVNLENDPFRELDSELKIRIRGPVVVDSMRYQTDTIMDAVSNTVEPRVLQWESLPQIERKIIYPVY